MVFVLKPWAFIQVGVGQYMNKALLDERVEVGLFEVE